MDMKMLRDLFREKIFQNPSNEHQNRIRSILKCDQQTEMTEIQILRQVQKSLGISVYLIDITRNEELQQNDYKCYYLQTTEWVITNIENIIDVDKAVIILYKFGNTYYWFATFTEHDTCDYRIWSFISSEIAVFTEIGLDLLMTNDKLAESVGSITHNFNIYSENSYCKRIIQILYERENFDAIDFLLRNECRFPSFANEQKIPQVQKLIKSRDEFHDFIRNDRQEEIEKYLQNNPNFKYYFNQDNNSACATAIQVNNFELYKFLHSLGLTVCNNEEMGIMKYSSFLEYFRNIELPYGSDFDRHMRMFTSVTWTRQKLDNHFSPEEIYKKLSELDDLYTILRIMCKTEFLTIVIDYQAENISRICLYALKAKGLYDPRLNRLFIAGGNDNMQMMATIVKQMTHFALNLIYDNNCKPYSPNDIERETMLKKIVLKIEANIRQGLIEEPIIKRVFISTNNSGQRYTEIILITYEILVYYGNDKGTEILKTQTPELFDFYNDYVKPDIEKYLRCHCNCNDYFMTPFYKQIENCRIYFEKNNDLTPLIINKPYKDTVIETDFVQLTCLKLFQIITRNESDYNIENTYFIDSDTYFNNERKVHFYFQNYKLLIVADTSKNFDSSKWHGIESYVQSCRKRFIFILHTGKLWDFKNIKTITDSFEFRKFDDKSQELIYNTLDLNFQGQNLNLCKFINCNIKAEIFNKILTAGILNDFIFHKRCPIIGTEITKPSSYIDRLFTVDVYSFIELYEQLIDDDTSQFFACDITNKLEYIRELQINGKTLKLFTKEFTRISKDINLLESMLMSRLNYGRSKLQKEKISLENQILIFNEINHTEHLMIVDNYVIFINSFTDLDLNTFYECNKSYNINLIRKYNNFFISCKSFDSSDNIRRKIYSKKEQFSENDFFEILTDEKIILIAATAGMGKSTMLQNLSNSLFKKDSMNWISTILLKNSFKILDNYNEDHSDPDDCLDLSAELLQLKHFEKELFKYCCTKMNNVYLFFDGADELGQKYTDKILQLIRALSKTNIKHIVVSLRLNLKSQFEKELKTSAIEIVPFKYREQVEYLNQHFNGQETKRVTNINENTTELLNYVDEFNDLFGNPIQLYLLVKTFEIEPSLFENGFSLIKMYKKFIDKKLEMDLEANLQTADNLFRFKDIKGALKTLIEKQLVMMSVKVLLEQDEIVEYFLKENDLKEYDDFNSNFNNWKMYEGLIDGVNLEKPNFIHRTYSEYFFAHFLINFKNWKPESVSFFYNKILVDQRFDMVRQFLNSYDENLEILSRNPSHFPIPSNKHNAVYQNVNEGNLKIVQYLHKLRFNMSTNIRWSEERFSDEPRKREKIETIKYLLTVCTDFKPKISEAFQLLRIGTFPKVDKELTKAIFKSTPFEFALDSAKVISAAEYSQNFKEKLSKLKELWSKAQAAPDNELEQLVVEIDQVMSKMCLGYYRPATSSKQP